MILEFPYISGPFIPAVSCLNGVFIYYGKNVPTDILIKDVTSSAKKNKADDIVRVAKKYGFDCQKTSGDVNDIIDCIVQEIPVIINLQAWGRPNIDYTDNYNFGHFAVAIGFEEDNIIFADPYCLCRTHLTHEELMRRWHDKENESEYNHHTMIFLTGKEPSFKLSTVKHME